MSWEIQTDIFETNIINLGIVIIVVIFFVGDAVNLLLSQRQELIFNNLKQAKSRAEEIEQSYNNAQKKLQSALNQATEIKLQTEKLIGEQNEQYQIKISADIQKLKDSTISSIFYQKKKIKTQVSQKTIDLTISKVNQIFNRNLNQNAQKSINKLSINSLYSLLNKNY